MFAATTLNSKELDVIKWVQSWTLSMIRKEYVWVDGTRMSDGKKGIFMGKIVGVKNENGSGFGWIVTLDTIGDIYVKF